jgi:Glycosyl hydrolases family 18.
LLLFIVRFILDILCINIILTVFIIIGYFKVGPLLTSKILTGTLQVGPEELIPALDKCTHLVYQYAQISKDFEIEALRPDISTESGANLFRKITDLKQTFPKLKVLISLAGADSVESQQRYIDVVSGIDVVSSTKVLKRISIRTLEFHFFPLFGLVKYIGTLVKQQND